MTIAQGVAKQSRWKRQTGKGALAGASGGQVVRRVTSTFELVKDTYTTETEITSTQQLKSSRHGTKQIKGALSGILSPGTYDDMISAVLRKDFAVGGTTASLSTVAASVMAPNFVRDAGSWLTDGFKVGDVIRTTGWSTTGTANNGKNLLITALTALQMSVMSLDGTAVAAKAEGDSVSFATPGKFSFTPLTGHTNVYYTVEEWYPDSAVSERNQDCKIDQASFKLPGSGNATLDLTVVGLDQTKDTTAYFTAPTAETTSGAVAAANGVLIVNGAVLATVTDLSFDIKGNEKPADGVVGTNIRPDIFRGKVMASGSFSAYFEGGSIPDLFLNETITSIYSVLTASSDPAADFIGFSLYNVHLNTSTPDDGETGLKRTYSFVCTLNAAGGAGTSTEDTTIRIQDSLAA